MKIIVTNVSDISKDVPSADYGIFNHTDNAYFLFGKFVGSYIPAEGESEPYKNNLSFTGLVFKGEENNTLTWEGTYPHARMVTTEDSFYVRSGGGGLSRKPVTTDGVLFTMDYDVPEGYDMWQGFSE